MVMTSVDLEPYPDKDHMFLRLSGIKHAASNSERYAITVSSHSTSYNWYDKTDSRSVGMLDGEATIKSIHGKTLSWALPQAEQRPQHCTQGEQGEHCLCESGNRLSRGVLYKSDSSHQIYTFDDNHIHVPIS